MTPTNSKWQELNDGQYHQLQTSLLKTKGGDDQRQFLEAAKDNDDFLAFVAEQVETLTGETLPLFDGALTEQSFKQPTADQELRIYELWQHIPPNTACRVSFWAGVTLQHLDQGKIPEASWLAANGGVIESGDERIDHALSLGDDEAAKPIDDCVRTIFRRMSGLPAARGNRSVFVDCVFGRAWWRERLVSRILKRGQSVQDRPTLLRALRRNQGYWERLVMMIVSRGSVFGSDNVQDAVINSLAVRITNDPNTPLQNDTTLRSALRRLSNIAAATEFGVLSFEETTEIVETLFDRVETGHS